GIRVLIVTGVQTCALPISIGAEPAADGAAARFGTSGEVGARGGAAGAAGRITGAAGGALAARGPVGVGAPGPADPDAGRITGAEIGRASCRERGEIWVGEG